MNVRIWEYPNNFKFLPSLKEFPILGETRDFKFIFEF